MSHHRDGGSSASVRGDFVSGGAPVCFGSQRRVVTVERPAENLPLLLLVEIRTDLREACHSRRPINGTPRHRPRSPAALEISATGYAYRWCDGNGTTREPARQRATKAMPAK